MAGFKTHIATSTVLGVGYGVAGHYLWHMPPATCVLAAGFCSVAGMLPDLDSDSGVPLRESIAFAAALVPMLTIDRFQYLGLSTELMVLIGAAAYLAIRFGLATLLKRYTVHRGMFHSLPAAAIVGLLGYLVCGGATEWVRYYKAGGFVLGFLSHLVLDELWAISFRGGLRFKKSFGTALKLFGHDWWANVSAYAKLIALAALAFGDPMLMNKIKTEVQQRGLQIEHTATDYVNRVWR